MQKPGGIGCSVVAGHHRPTWAACVAVVALCFTLCFTITISVAAAAAACPDAAASQRFQ